MVYIFFPILTEENIDNCRYESLDFTVDEDALVHGFAGYFDTNLYKDVMLSE